MGSLTSSQPPHEDVVRMPTLVSRLQDAAASPEALPDALKALAEAAEVAGAALIISNKSTGTVEEACFVGLSAEFKSDYIRHYAALDPYSPLLDESWKKLSLRATKINFVFKSGSIEIFSGFLFSLEIILGFLHISFMQLIE